MSKIREEKLDLWCKEGFNILFVGKHGVGKTSMVKDAFQRNNLNWLYFSAATMDPWVDFIGVPKESSTKLAEPFQIVLNLLEADKSKTLARQWIAANWKLDDKGTETVIKHVIEEAGKPVYLDLIRPRQFAEDKVEALFFDEFNRAPSKVRNAVMELLQFKSINGRVFKNLKMVWAAINPEDDEQNKYDVEALDPAQADRFHMAIEIPYEPNGPFFEGKYGKQLAKAAIGWWTELPPEEKNKVSPRRLEYALDVRAKKGDMRDVLPITSGVSKLIGALNSGYMPDKLEALMANKDIAEARKFLASENNYAAAMKYIPLSQTMMEFFLPILTKEKIAVVISDNEQCRKHVLGNIDKIPLFRDVCTQVVRAGQNKPLADQIRGIMQNNQAIALAMADPNNSIPDKAYFNAASPASGWSNTLREIEKLPRVTTSERAKIYEKIEKVIPKVMTADDALKTLELLSASLEKAMPSAVTSAAMTNLVGMVNHCMSELSRQTGLDWSGMLEKHGVRFRTLMERIKEGGVANKLQTQF